MEVSDRAHVQLTFRRVTRMTLRDSPCLFIIPIQRANFLKQRLVFANFTIETISETDPAIYAGLRKGVLVGSVPSYFTLIIGFRYSLGY